MSNKDFYFKVKPKKSVKVTSAASIHIPFRDQNTFGNWNAGFGIPYVQSEPKYFSQEINKYEGSVSSALLAEAGFGGKTSSIASAGIYSANESLNKILRRELTAEKMYQDQYSCPISLLAIYKSWDSTKFTNFILETLVGKAMTQALLYNYFGFPVGNIGSIAGRSGFDGSGKEDTEENPYAIPIASDTSWYTTGQQMGEIPSLGNSTDNLIDGTNFDFSKGILNLNDLFTDEEKEDPDVYTPDLDLRITQTLMGSYGEKSSQGHTFSVVYSNSRTSGIYPTNINSTVNTDVQNEYTINFFDYKYSPNGYWDYMPWLSTLSPKFETGRYDTNFSAPDQKLTPTYAKMYMPSLKSATYPDLSGLMGGGLGAFDSKWYKNGEEGTPDGSAEKYFKYSNLVTALKLVPPNIDPSEVEFYLNNPHKTLNEVRKYIFKFVDHVVPRNIRYAGPKPATKEPGTDSLTGENKPEACEDLLISNQEDINRVITGSFFEINSLPPVIGPSGTGTKENYLGAADPNSKGEYPYGAVEDVQRNLLWGKGASSLFKYNRPEYYGEDPARYLYNKSSTKMEDSVKKYSYKFGLPPTNFIGIPNPLGLSGNNADSIPGANEARKFAVIPNNEATIKSMIDSLPDTVRTTMIQDGGADIQVIDYSNNPKGTYFELNNLDGKDPLEFTRYITGLWMMYHFGSIPSNFYETEFGNSVLEGFKFSDYAGGYPFKVDLHADGSKGGLGIYADMVPIIFQAIAQDQSILKYLPGGNINISALSDISYEGFTEGAVNHFLNNFIKFFGSFSDVGDNATGTLFSVENLLNGGQSVFFAAKNGVPYKVQHRSPLIFPVWDYGNETNGHSTPLSSIEWPKLINNKASSGLDQTEDGSPWLPYLENNPLLLKKKRKCVPDWCKSLQIYPTSEKTAMSYGLINPDIKMDATANVYYGENKVVSNKYLNTSEFLGGEPPSFPTNDFSNNYRDEHLSLYEKAKPFITIDYQYDTDIAKGSHLYEKHDSDDYPDEFQKDYRHGEGSSEYYRNNIMAAAKLTYAVDMEIDETKLIIDLLQHGCFGLAGDSKQYTDAGINLDDLFRATKGQGLYSDSLNDDYEKYLKTIAGTLESVDFSQIPSFLKKPDVSEDMLKAIDENLPAIEEKYNSLALPTDDSIFDKFAATSYILVDQGEKTSPKAKATLRVTAGFRSDVVAHIPNFTVVKILKESTNGMNEYNLVRVVDPESPFEGTEGYVEVNDLVSIRSDILFSDVFSGESNGNLKLANLLDSKAITQMTEGQKLTIPTWWTSEVPYYHREDGEYWYRVELEGETCIIGRNDLAAKKDLALRKGVEELLLFYNRLASKEQIDLFVDTHLAARIDDYFIDIRPGEHVKFLLKVGAIYLDAFPPAQKSLKQLKAESSKIITIDTRYYINHLVQATYGLNQMYIDILRSDFRVEGVNFALEAERLDRIPVLFKKLLSFNNFSITSEDQNLINVGFNEDFDIVFISYNEGAKENNEKLLSVGYEYIKQQEPFNVRNTMSLFYHHRQLKNPLLKWQQAIKEIFLDPKPNIIPKEQATEPEILPTGCKLPKFTLPSWQELLGPIAAQLDDALQLDPRFDLGSFQFSLTDYLPPCPKPPTGKGKAIFRGEVSTEAERLFFDSFESLTRMKDLQTGYKEYVGDFMSSAEGLRQIGESVVDLDDLWNKVLRRVGGIDAIYMKICKCFLDLAGLDTIEVPNFKVDLQGPSAGLNIKPLSYIPALDDKSPANQSVTGGVKNTKWNKGDEYEYDTGSFGSVQDFKDSFNNEPEVFDAADLICSFCFEIPSFFLRLPTTNILDFLLDALLKALEFILAQLLVELFATLLELLLRCPELTCPEGVRRVVDYGAQDLNNIIASPGIGDSPAVFVDCGIVMEEGPLSSTASDVKSLLNDISQSLSSGEILELLDGSMSIKLAKVVQSKVDRYPKISSQLPNTAKIRDFFRCVGLKVPQEKLAKIEDDIIKTYQDPDTCDNLFEKAKAQLKSKCGDLEDVDRLVKAATEIEIDNYVALANLIRKVPDLTQQIPPLFSDDKGNKGILSGLPNPTMEFAVEETVKNMFAVVETQLSEESRRFTDPEKRVMVKVDNNRRTLSGNGNPLASLFYTPLTPLGGPAAVLWMMVASQPDLSKNELYTIWFPIKDKLAPFKEEKNENGLDDYLTDFATNVPSYLSFTSGQSVTLNIPLPEDMGEKVTANLFFSKPDQDDNDNLIYTNNIAVGFDASQIIDAPFSLTANDPNARKISETLQQTLDKYPLTSEETAPQIQYFTEFMIDKVLPKPSEIGQSKYDKLYSNLYPIIQDEIYRSVFSSILTGIAETIGNSEVLNSFDVDLFDDFIEANPLGGGIVLLLRGLWDSAGVNVRAPTKKQEMGLLNFNPTKTLNGFIKGILDTEHVADKVKKNYDFSNYDDPNSNDLGMPQYALLEGVVSAYLQVLIGDVLLRAIPTISKFPKYLISDGSMITNLISKILLQDFESAEEGGGNIASAADFTDICMTLLSRRSSYTFSNPKATEPGDSGTIIQKKTGKTYEINDGIDALKFMIMENIDIPLDFIYSKIGSFSGSGQNFTKISQVNPLDLISYNFPLYVHDDAHSVGFDKPPTSTQEQDGYDFPSSLFGNARYREFLNGKFYNQVYFEIEDWADEEEAQANDGIYVQEIINRPKKLRKILSQDNFFELIRLMSGQQELGSIDGSGTGLLTLEQNQGEPFIKFFKSISLGTRFCYSFITSEREFNGATSGIAGFEEVNEFIKPYSDGQFEFFKTISKAVDDALGIKFDSNTTGATFNLIDSDLKDYIELNKTILIIEDDLSLTDAKSKPSKNPPAKTYIFPFIESKTDLMNNDTGQSFELLNEPTQEVALRPENLREFLFESYGISLFTKNLTNIVLSEEYTALLQYCFPTKDLVEMFTVFNLALVSADPDVKHAFTNTKKIIKTLFASIYDMTGPEKYKKMTGVSGYN